MRTHHNSLTNDLDGKYLNWETLYRSFQNSNNLDPTFSNSNVFLTVLAMFCVNLIVLQKYIYSFVDHTK